MSKRIRRATIGDYDICYNLYSEMCKSQEEQEYGEQVSSTVLIQDKVNAWIHEDDLYNVNLLYDGEELIGMCMMHHATERAVLSYWHVGLLYILPQHRRKGYGYYFLKTILDMYSVDNLDFTISVFAWNTPAIRLYEKCGFKPKTIKMKLERAESNEL